MEVTVTSVAAFPFENSFHHTIYASDLILRVVPLAWPTWPRDSCIFRWASLKEVDLLNFEETPVVMDDLTSRTRIICC
jgi:hypothetical protein